MEQCPVILSVVPPRDAEATAQRIVNALLAGASLSKHDHIYFADLNAVAPSTCKKIAGLFDKASVPVRFIDGSILGGPPRAKTDPDAGTNVTTSISDPHYENWLRPRIPISGPYSLSSSLLCGDQLASVLNMYSVSSDIGAASGLKMCFAAMTKGFTAIATQAFTTAHSLGVADALRDEASRGISSHFALAQKSVPAMPPKAYRWVREMEEIALTMSEEGGWGREMFDGAAGVYDAVARDEVLGREKVGKRTRGKDVEDVAAAMSEGLAKKRKKNE